MESSSQVIVNKLKEFIIQFPNTKVRYENHVTSKTHFIEVVPKEIYHLDLKYDKWELDFFNFFISKFNTENICFISDDAIVKLDKIDFEIEGSLYKSDFSVSKNCYSSYNYKINVNTNKIDNFNIISVISNDIKGVKTYSEVGIKITHVDNTSFALAA